MMNTNVLEKRIMHLEGVVLAQNNIIYENYAKMETINMNMKLMAKLNGNVLEQVADITHKYDDAFTKIDTDIALLSCKIATKVAKLEDDTSFLMKSYNSITDRIRRVEWRPRRDILPSKTRDTYKRI
jgi:hypothetical protein